MRLQSGADLWPGIERGGWRWSFLERFTISQPERLSASPVKIQDPDGEALFPFQPSGRAHSGGLWLGAAYERGIFYFDGTARALGFDPSVSDFSNPLTFGGAPYGRIDWHSAKSTIFYGHDDIGVRGAFRHGGFFAHYNAYFTLTYAANAAGQNTLALADIGVKGEASYTWRFLQAFVLAAKRCRVMLTSNVAQHLDPELFQRSRIDFIWPDRYLRRCFHARRRRGAAECLFVVIRCRGESATLARVLLQALGKLYDQMLWLYSGDGNAQGQTINGNFYLSPGDKQLSSRQLERRRCLLHRSASTSGRPRRRLGRRSECLGLSLHRHDRVRHRAARQ